MSPILYLILFLGVALSGLAVFAITLSTKWLKLLLSFSGAFLFAISVLHLLPEIYSPGNKTVGIYILAGFFFQVGLEFFSQGIEHGHIHPGPAAGKLPLAILISLSIHSFLEGMPLSGNGSGYNKALFTGILLHNIPISVALMTLLKQSRLSTTKILWALLLFACMTPLGAICGTALGRSMGDASVCFNNLMGIVVGIFLHISTTILFESSENHRFNFIKFLSILLGAVVAFLIL
jgi:zinc and cadmium transporter